MREKVVLAYSGGLDTSIIIPWLKENYNCEVIAMIADVGQGDDIDAVIEKAHKTGASKVSVVDLRHEFLSEYVFPALRPVAASREKIHSRDRNIWHLSHEGGELEDAANAPYDSTWQMTRSPQEAPDREETVTVGFDAGTPVSVDGQKLEPASLVELLNEIGGRNAIGRIDLVENRFVGIKSRGCYETPGGTLLHTAHRELEALCLDRDLMHFKQYMALKYAELVYYGLWFTPLREALDAFVNETQKEVTGTVTLKLYKGNSSIAGRESEFSLYRTDLSSFTISESSDHKDADGFIRILGLPARSRARLRQEVTR